MKEPRPQVPTEVPKRKLAYMEQREWDGMEAKILEGEQELTECQRELEAPGSDATR